MASVEWMSEEGVLTCGKKTCLFGPSSSGKTTLLFQHAISCASQSKSVLFVTPLGLDQLPLLDKNPSQETLKRIHFVYPKTFEELLSLFNGVHMSQSVYKKGHCVLIDDMHFYLTGQQDVVIKMTKLCSHILDAIQYCDCSISNDHDMCYVMTVHSSLLSSMKADILSRWFNTCLNVTPVGNGQFILHSLTSRLDIIAKYHLTKTDLNFF